MKSPRIHTSNLLYLGICMLSIIAFFFVGIYPNLKSLDEVDEEIGALNHKVRTQELLYPVYLRLLAEITHRSPTKLPIPKSHKISTNDLTGINKAFMDIANENNATFISAVPDASNYLEDMGYLTLNVSFAGDFFDLRSLLLAVCRLPYLEAIDQMQMETVNEKKRLIIKMKVAQQ